MEQSRRIQEAVGILTAAGYKVFEKAPTVELVTTVGIEGCNKSGAILKINGGHAREVKPGTTISILGRGT